MLAATALCNLDAGQRTIMNGRQWPATAREDDFSILKNIREDELAAIKGLGKLGFSRCVASSPRKESISLTTHR